MGMTIDTAIIQATLLKPVYLLIFLSQFFFFFKVHVARRSNQSILKEISPGCSLEGMMLNLKKTPVLWLPHRKS